MKRMNVIMLLFATAIFFSCKSQKTSNLGDGLFADIQTNKGNIVIKLNYKETPVTVANFVTLAEGTNSFVKSEFKGKPYYNGVIFHRVIKDFMIQGGDPTGTGMGDPGYRFEDEFVEHLKHDKKGILSMANAGPATNGSQFFITHVPTPHLDGRHTVFGETVEGLEVIDSIANVATAEANRPVEDVKINNVLIIRNGKEAEKFNATKTIEDYFANAEKREKERENKIKEAVNSFLAEVKEQEPKAKALPSGVKIFTLKESKGETPKHTQQVLVNYAGYLTDGTLFDSNIKEVEEAFGKYNIARDRGNGYTPIPMQYSKSAQLIPGFKEALLTLKVGEKVRVFIPSALAYGERGAQGVIPPNSDLIFDIEVLGIAQ
ncbi:peptidylprolyl isomerase [Capnocytophaga stomatis]|uniref:peptidylprolyl isomerase n=1 Tax=Capnocytophaga stomatis TaxID=1848904 RepID=A0A250FYN1_9FLAO|nr:peptidylprolyl isomerase [Capnocytophaga stomatis]ATA90173.1 peptidylprolyl isomerase [Capnocytophaga stomatis]GIM49697.1 peptidylprolyl isomerase [Capnocytophaga stomatis]